MKAKRTGDLTGEKTAIHFAVGVAGWAAASGAGTASDAASVAAAAPPPDSTATTEAVPTAFQKSSFPPSHGGSVMSQPSAISSVASRTGSIVSKLKLVESAASPRAPPRRTLVLWPGSVGLRRKLPRLVGTEP